MSGVASSTVPALVTLLPGGVRAYLESTASSDAAVATATGAVCAQYTTLPSYIEQRKQLRQKRRALRRQSRQRAHVKSRRDQSGRGTRARALAQVKARARAQAQAKRSDGEALSEEQVHLRARLLYFYQVGEHTSSIRDDDEHRRRLSDLRYQLLLMPTPQEGEAGS